MHALPSNDPTLLLSDLDFVRSLARQLCRDEHEADDISQATAATALEKAPAHVASWRAWLTVVLRNLHQNSRRAERVRARASSALLAAPSDRHAPSAAEVAEREELRRHVVELVMQLPDEFREVVLLRHFRGMDTRETAAALGVPESTVRTRLKRGVDRLRAKLDASHGGERDVWVAALLPLAHMVPSRAAAAGAPILAVAALLLAAVATVVWWLRPHEVPRPAQADGVVAAASGDEAPAIVGPQQDPRPTAPATERSRAEPAAAWPFGGSVLFGGDVPRPAAGATVRVVADFRERPGTAPIELGTVTTDTEGRFAASLAAIAELPDALLRRMAIFLHVDADGGWQQIVDYEPLYRLRTPIEATPIELRPGRYVKGRIVDPSGHPVAGAFVLDVDEVESQRVPTARDGTFALPVGDPVRAGGQRVLLASHPAHGFSRACFVQVVDGTDARIGDVVLGNPQCVVSGRVRHASGEGASGVTVELTYAGDDRDAPVHVDGIAIPRFCASTSNANANRWRVETDDEGRFVIRTLRAGPHALYVADVPAAQQLEVSSVTPPLDLAIEGAVLELRAQDEFGLPVDLRDVDAFRWRGNAADAARARYEADGPVAELLATAESRERVTGTQLACEPDSFVVVSARWPYPGVVGGMAYGACRLPAGSYRGVVDVAPRDLERSAELHVEARDADGNVLSPLFVRVAQVLGDLTLPVPLGSAGRAHDPWTGTPGPWHRVPDHGRLLLPSGALRVEVLAGASYRLGMLEQAPFLATRHDVTIGEGEVHRLKTTARRGVQPEFELLLPTTEADERIAIQTLHAYLEDVSTGARHVLPLEFEAPTGPPPRSVVARARSAVPAGTYTVRIPTLTILRVRRDDASDRMVPCSVGSLRAFQVEQRIEPGGARVALRYTRP